MTETWLPPETVGECKHVDYSVTGLQSGQYNQGGGEGFNAQHVRKPDHCPAGSQRSGQDHHTINADR